MPLKTTPCNRPGIRGFTGEREKEGSGKGVEAANRHVDRQRGGVGGGGEDRNG